MKYNPVIRKETQRLFHAKSKRRQDLARLPIEEKILILIQLQKIAMGVPRKQGKAKIQAWNVRLR